MNFNTTIKSFLAIACLCISSSVIAQSYGPNLVVNGNFENPSTEPWVKNVNTARDITLANVIADSVCIRFTGKTAYSNIYQFIKVEHGARYEFGFTARIQDAVGPAGSPSADHAIEMALKDKLGTEGVNLAVTTPITTSTNTTEKFEFVNEAKYDSILVTISKNNGIGYADNIYVKKMIGESISKNKTSNIKLVANSNNSFTVLSDKQIGSIAIYNLGGVCIEKRVIAKSQATLALAGAKSGVYIVKVALFDGTSEIKKLVLK